ncbi:MFS transporter [Acidocella sp.]|uniref:MFS transporter n=1 Tax=Acidocella sp. TaxID=50710 RepID=UPI00263841CD|nr:MFS transporter [Acidocella sp.]
MDRARAREWTMRLVFVMAGIGISVWAIIIPLTKIRFGISDAALGGVLFMGGLGGVAVMPLAGLLVARLGSRAALALAGGAMALLLPALSAAPSAGWFTAILFVYGAVFGTLDAAMNAQGAVVERRAGRLLMSGFHACYSLGTLGIVLGTSLCLRLGLAEPLCAGASALLAALVLTQTPRLVGREGDDQAEGRHLALPNRATLALGLLCFTAFMTEGVATDWSTIFLRFERHMALPDAPLGYAAFAVAMVGARLLGDGVATRFGQPAVLRLGTLLGALGFGLAIVSASGWVAVAGFGLVGLGTGNMAPLIFSAAARVPGMSAHQAMPAVVGLGYAGFLVGPVVIGLIAGRFGLGGALGLDGALLVGACFGARAVA